MPDIVAPPTPPRQLPFSDRKKASIAGLEGNRRRWQRYRNQQALQKAVQIADKASPDSKPSALRLSRALIEAKLQLPETDAITTETLARAVDRLASAEVKLASIGRIRQSRGPAGDRASGDTSGSPAKSYGRVMSDDE